MKILKSFGICSLFFVFYYFTALISCIFISNSVLATIVTNVIVIVIGSLYYKKHKYINSTGFSKCVVLLLFVFMFVVWLFSQITAVFVYNTFADTAYDNYKELSSADSVLYLLLTFCVAPIAEEILLRGIVFNILQNSTPIGVAYFVSALLFAVMHGTATHLFLAFSAGFLFAIVYEYTGHLRYSIVFHSVFNIFSVFFGGLDVPDIFFMPVVIVSVDVLIIASLIFLSYVIYKLKFGKNDGISSLLLRKK